MKNLFVILVLSAFMAFQANAQYAYPRYGTAVNQDNTGRVLTYGTITKADTAGSTSDTVTTLLQDGSGRSFYNTDLVFNLTDSAVFSIKSPASMHFGDHLTVFIANASGSNHFVNFLGYSAHATVWGMATTGTKISPASAGWALLQFWFDGLIWREISRDVH